MLRVTTCSIVKCFFYPKAFIDWLPKLIYWNLLFLLSTLQAKKINETFRRFIESLFRSLVLLKVAQIIVSFYLMHGFCKAFSERKFYLYSHWRSLLPMNSEILISSVKTIHCMFLQSWLKSHYSPFLSSEFSPLRRFKSRVNLVASDK